MIVVVSNDLNHIGNIRNTFEENRPLLHSEKCSIWYPHSSFHFFCILEMYNAETNTFLTHVRELEFALHEMHEVLALSISETPYKEYVPSAKKFLGLKTIRQTNSTYWE